jgi:hypothetical protein
MHGQFEGTAIVQNPESGLHEIGPVAQLTFCPLTLCKVSFANASLRTIFFICDHLVHAVYHVQVVAITKGPFFNSLSNCTPCERH